MFKTGPTHLVPTPERGKEEVLRISRFRSIDPEAKMLILFGIYLMAFFAKIMEK